MSEYIYIRGVRFNNVSFSDAVELLFKRLGEKKQTALYTPNSEIVEDCIQNEDIMKIINSGDVIVPDGIGVVKAAKILSTPFVGGKVAGIEVGEAVVKNAGAEHKIFLLGSKPGVAELARDELKKKYPDAVFTGCADGYFKKDGEESEKIIEKINESGADILFVCLGAPTQEKWIYENRNKLPKVMLFLALGGSLDGYSGNVKRAPRLFITLGLEWFYRLLKEPWRFKRMLKLPKFYFGIWKYKLSGKKPT